MKTLMSLLAAGMVALVAAPTMALDTTVLSTTAFFVGEDFEGNVIVRELSVSELDHTTTCGGTAPTVTACGTGTHVMTTGTSLSHGATLTCSTVSALPTTCYVGRTMSQVSDGVRTRTFNCDIATPYQVPGGVGITCAGVGSFPITTFTHNCAASGWRAVAPAAVGDWGCVVNFHSA